MMNKMKFMEKDELGVFNIITYKRLKINSFLLVWGFYFKRLAGGYVLKFGPFTIYWKDESW